MDSSEKVKRYYGIEDMVGTITTVQYIIIIAGTRQDTIEMHVRDTELAKVCRIECMCAISLSELEVI